MQTMQSELGHLKIIDMDAGEVFSNKPSGTRVKGYEKPSFYTPAIDPDYIFQEGSRDIIVWLLNPSDPLYVFGPCGSGKTSCIKQLAARLNYPVFEVTGHGRLEFADLAGHLTVQDGNMTFQYGPLALAMMYGGIFLVNEIDLTSPEVAAGLNGVLDGSPLCIAENGGELIKPHPMFRFVATANTNGGGDETGLYQGAQRQNLAFADRFMLCEMTYPTSDVEKKLLEQRFPDLPESLCEKMVQYANEVRKLFMGETGITNLVNAIDITFSTRSLLRWGELISRFQPLARQGIQPVAYALDRALAYRASRETRAMLHELAQRIFPQHDNVKFATENSDVNVLQNKDAIRFLRLQLGKLSLGDTAKVHLRKQSDNGINTKDWIGEARSAGMDLSFGKTGNVNNRRFFELSLCINQNSISELEARAIKKLREGYALLVDECVL